jgi:hypothetical protein
MFEFLHKHQIIPEASWAAAHHVIGDIENYNRIGGLMNERCRLAAEIYAMKEMFAPRNKAIMTLIKFHNWGLTDNEIQNVYEFLSGARQLAYSKWWTDKAKPGQFEPVFKTSNDNGNRLGTINSTAG